MSASVWTWESSLNSVADAALEMAARFWFLVAVVGQWIFVFYVAAFYGRSAMQGDFAAWNRVMSRGYIPGDADDDGQKQEHGDGEIARSPREA